ncbi:MAG: hypothetical protein IJR13_01700 [Bacteroidales bacterium]|nr:hypothetical protein [Bacteroidales bacterium]
MKRLHLAILLLLSAAALNAAAQEKDSAEWVVARYMALMNYDALPHDKMIAITTLVTSAAMPGDTGIVRRYYAMPNSYRVEVWYGDTLFDAWHNDGTKLYRHYDAAQRQWVDASEIFYYDHIVGYDFRGPLYHRATNGTTLIYGGTATFEGHPIYRVSTSVPSMYDREYYFEQESGLLFLFVEKESTYGDEQLDASIRVDWRSIDEYLPLGESLIISHETYQQNAFRTTLLHTPRLLPIDRTLFSHD